jgi:hypothetical protein
MNRTFLLSGILLFLTIPALAQPTGAQSGDPGTPGYERGELRSGFRPGFGAARVTTGMRGRHVRHHHRSHKRR